jgi:hypothetical protein
VQVEHDGHQEVIEIMVPFPPSIFSITALSASALAFLHDAVHVAVHVAQCSDVLCADATVARNVVRLSLYFISECCSGMSLQF